MTLCAGYRVVNSNSWTDAVLACIRIQQNSPYRFVAFPVRTDPTRTNKLRRYDLLADFSRKVETWTPYGPRFSLQAPVLGSRLAELTASSSLSNGGATLPRSADLIDLRLGTFG